MIVCWCYAARASCLRVDGAKKTMAVDKFQRPVHSLSRRARAFCLGGALVRAYASRSHVVEVPLIVIVELCSLLGFSPLALGTFNDAEETSLHDILGCVDAAISLAETGIGVVP